MKRSICSLLLILFLLAGLFVPATASSSMTTSSDGKAFIKEQQAGQSYDLARAEKHVNSFLSKYGLKLKQHQFDALVDMAVAYPGSNVFSSGYNVEKLIASGNYTDITLANAFTAWVKDGDGNVSAEKLIRRIRELKLFLYGSYDGNYDPSFRYVLFNPNRGTLVESNLVVCYPVSQQYMNLPVATRSGMHFAGWYTTASGGDHIHNNTRANSDRTVYAHWSDKAVSDPNVGEASGPSLKTSEECITFLKETEGFSKHAYWDYSQYTIGYGTACDPADYPNGISKSEADHLLRVELSKFEAVVDKALKNAKISHNQHQYDAIISFTFNLGEQWIKPANKIFKVIMNGHSSESEFLQAIGAWSRAGGEVVPGLMRRRMDEANMYLNGSYERFSTTYFAALVSANGGILDSTDKESGYFYCRAGEPMGELPTASRNGYNLKGWYSKKVDGSLYTPNTVAPTLSSTNANIYYMYAQWTTEDVEPPTEPPTTEPPTTEPPTEPPTTEPPTEPPTTEPPTEPPTTEPPTEPPVTEPEPPIEDDPAEAFGDISKGDWFYPFVADAVSKGLLYGMSDTSFGPEEPMTRSMVVAVLHRMEGSPAPTGPHPFTDVNPNRWYTDPVVWAYENNIVYGLSDTIFGTKESVSRQQIITMLYRYAQYCNMDVSAQADLADYADAAKVSSYAKDAFRWAVATGIISGSNGNLDPYGLATRAQCAKIMAVFSELPR